MFYADVYFSILYASGKQSLGSLALGLARLGSDVVEELGDAGIAIGEAALAAGAGDVAGDAHLDVPDNF